MGPASPRGCACLTKALTGVWGQPFPQSSDRYSSVPNWVGGFAKDSPVLGQSRYMWDTGGGSGSYRVLPVSLLYPHPSVPHPSPCASVSSSHTSSSLKPARPLSCPFPLCDLPPPPSAARAGGKEPWRVRGGEPGRKSSWLGREGGQLEKNQMEGATGARS